MHPATGARKARYWELFVALYKAGLIYRDKRLVNQWAADHTHTLAGGRPILALDMYEHAYHMDYGAAAARYVDVFMEAIRWDDAVKLYDRYARES